MLHKLIIFNIFVVCLMKFSENYEMRESRVIYVERKHLNLSKNTTIGSKRTPRGKYLILKLKLYLFCSQLIIHFSSCLKLNYEFYFEIAVYFPIFTNIELSNEDCLTTDGLIGTCYSRTECDLFRGITRGVCARGFGVCCFCEYLSQQGWASSADSEDIKEGNMAKMDARNAIPPCPPLFNSSGMEIVKHLLKNNNLTCN